MPNTKTLSLEEIEELKAAIERENARINEPKLSDDEKREKLNKLKAIKDAKLGIHVMDNPGDYLGNDNWDDDITISSTTDMSYDYETGVPFEVETTEIDGFTASIVETKKAKKVKTSVNEKEAETEEVPEDKKEEEQELDF